MKVVLKLGYVPHDGESVSVVADGKQTLLSPCDDQSMIVHITSRSNSPLRYSYLAQQGNTAPRREWRKEHSIPLSKGVKSLFVSDSWGERPECAPLHSSLFTDSIFRRSAPRSVSLESGKLMVEVCVPMVRPDQRVVMVGSCEALGAWDVSHGVAMADGGFPTWHSEPLVPSKELLGSEYKFVIIDSLTDEVIAWEQGANRTLSSCRGIAEDAIYIVEREPHFDLAAWRGAGVAIPLFSLRSEQSMGVGEFADLKKMVDWARSTGQKIIQILPINDTTMGGTWEDSYPYNANSIFALHPQYISLKAVGKLADKQQQAAAEKEGRRLNALPAVDYKAVSELKNSYLKQLYAESGEKTLNKKDFQKFFAENSYWLESYALFSLLRDSYSTPDFTQWGDEAHYCEELLQRYKMERGIELGYYYFVQYHLHLQLLDARAYASKNGVAFKGDIPIGVSRTSADVWVSPRLFRLDSQAGAPPDDFSIMGQNWGFPTYNWEEMALDDYAWWKARFSKMAEYFDAYRIDHILGFFRIWEIPLDAVHGLLGYFNPALPFTAEQMQSRYGFTFENAYLKPAINGWVLNQIFSDRAGEVTESFLRPAISGDLFEFRTEYNTQAKVAAAIEDKALRDGLLSLFDEVLFVEDPHKRGHFHPRIAAHNTFKYRAMSELDKQRYNELYTDFFYHLHNDFWQSEALKKLPMLVSATNMLTCGEDLGMIPDCVPQVMEREQILSLEIQRMPKDPALTFGEPWHYPYRSVCTTSTHDMNPLRAWLREDSATSERYFREILGIDHSMDDDCPAWICEKIVRQHLASPAMWVILPLQDWMSIDESIRATDPESERINVPANSRHYWRYRMHCTIEQLSGYDDFNAKISKLAGTR